MDPTQSAIEKIQQTPGLCPEALVLLQLAAEAQRTGVMPELPKDHCQCENPGPHYHPGANGKFCAVCGKDMKAPATTNDFSLFGTSDWRADGYQQLQDNAKTGDKIRGERRDGSWHDVTLRVVEGIMEGRHPIRFVYVGWRNEQGGYCESSLEAFATMHRQIVRVEATGEE